MIDLNGTLPAQILNFVLLVIILRAVAYKPIVKMLDARRMKIEESLAKADADEAEAAKLKAEYQAQLDEARAKAQSIIDAAVKRAEDEKEREIKATRAEIEQMKKNAQEDITRERLQAAEALKAQVAAISIAAAAKIIQQNLDERANAALIAEFADQLDKDKLGDLS
ncbi:hypothetical protein TAMA11512_16610 [Selenomonas sp. TAMA-11512]|uniref:F0F1 ATP synthase subunit B n=1 Tax=Selenomonas sp. TAMA-11512 TaxID=3095337 RepID=UPI0030859E59|nr:hypothetical protein TAMA11512_16610 [Selenomonas sp. TAMA-11512]